MLINSRRSTINRESSGLHNLYSFCLYRFCGQKDPSWSEIKHFVEFLNKQMTACEKTDFFKLEDPLGFKSFVVKFMITMSKVST